MSAARANVTAVTAVILAGGRASRLGGQKKPLISVGGVTILERQLAVLRPLFAEVIVAGGVAGGELASPDGAPLRVVPDLRPDQLGPLCGLEAALSAVTTDDVFLVAGDMPTLDPRLVARVLRERPSAEAALFVTARGPEPLHARYARAILPRVRAQLDRRVLSLRALLPTLDVALIDEPSARAIDPELRGFCNINSPADLAALEQRLAADEARAGGPARRLLA